MSSGIACYPTIGGAALMRERKTTVRSVKNLLTQRELRRKTDVENSLLASCSQSIYQRGQGCIELDGDHTGHFRTRIVDD